MASPYTIFLICQMATSKRSNALRSVEGVGTESRSRALRVRDISVISSTKPRYVVVFFCSRQSKTTCCRRVYRFFENVGGYRAASRLKTSTACSTNRSGSDFGRSSYRSIIIDQTCYSRGSRRGRRVRRVTSHRFGDGRTIEDREPPLGPRRGSCVTPTRRRSEAPDGARSGTDIDEASSTTDAPPTEV